MRRASATDAELVALTIAEANSARRPDGSDDVSAKLAKQIFESANSFALIEETKNGVGVVLVTQARTDGGRGDAIDGLAHLMGLAVSPASWGQGVGRALLLAAADEALKNGYRSMQLWTQVDNVRSTRLYESCGWWRTDDQIASDVTGEQLVRFEKIFGPPAI